MTPLEFAGDSGGYLTPAQAAVYMSRHPRTVRDMCAAGQITCLVQGTPRQARYKIHRSVVRAWLHRHTVQGRAS